MSNVLLCLTPYLGWEGHVQEQQRNHAVRGQEAPCHHRGSPEHEDN